jgi:hypothetical protein
LWDFNLNNFPQFLVVEPAPNNAANFASDDVQQQQPAEQANNDGRVVFRFLNLYFK